MIRKLIRKSALHLRTLGFKGPFLYKLVPVLSAIMKNPYPDLEKRRENIAEIILAEEKSFIATLNSSDALEATQNALAESLAKKDPKGPDGVILASAETSAVAGTSAFRLYDTHGIPLELTQDWWDKSFKIKFIKNVYSDAIKKAAEEQKNRSKSQSTMKGDVFSIKDLHLSVKETKFLGYKDYQTKAKVLKIIKDNTQVKKISKGQEGKIILDKTVFYGESGGQVSDTGRLQKGKNIFEVSDTKNSDKVILHIGQVKKGSFKTGDELLSSVDLERRLDIARNHTATHLLQAALRKVLGAHVQQQGSLVATDRLRFDFTHFKNIGQEELNRVEQLVNEYILNNYCLSVKDMSLSGAKKTGALAFFGEKYETKVRVVSVSDISRELCGGTHLEHTGQIGLFKITQESSIASGIRRIEAVTGRQAYKIIKEEEKTVEEISSFLGVPPEKIRQELQKKILRLKELEKQLDSHRLSMAKSSVETLIQDAPVINKIKVITQLMESSDMNILRKTVDLIKEKTGNSVIALGADNAGRALLVMGVTDDLAGKGIDASKLINAVAKIIGGSGGGRKDFAQAGGTNPKDFAKAFEQLKTIIGQIK